MKNKRLLFILFAISGSLALIGLPAAIFGGTKGISWLLYFGVALAVLSIAVSIYANTLLGRILKSNYGQLTGRIDNKFAQAKETLDRIYREKRPMLPDQNTNPESSQEQ